MISLCHNEVIVPVLVLDFRLYLFRLAERPHDFHLRLALDRLDDGFLPALRENPIHAFLIKNARIRLARLEVSLITADDEIAEVLAAILDARIGEARIVVRRDFVGKAQLEIAHRAVGPDQKIVALGRMFLGRAASDGAFFHRPVLGSPGPAGQVFAVEEGFEAGLDVFLRGRQSANHNCHDEPERGTRALGPRTDTGGPWGSRPGCRRGRLARDESWGVTPRRQAGRLTHYRAVHGQGDVRAKRASARLQNPYRNRQENESFHNFSALPRIHESPILDPTL